MNRDVPPSSPLRQGCHLSLLASARSAAAAVEFEPSLMRRLGERAENDRLVEVLVGAYEIVDGGKERPDSAPEISERFVAGSIDLLRPLRVIRERPRANLRRQAAPESLERSRRRS
jgi:hypothetical protein